MSEHWNAIVIGAGIGGLTAAARLAKENLRVLVVEKALHPGGTAYVYERKGYTFPMGPLGFSNPELVQEMLRELGIREGLDLKRVHYGLRAFHRQIRLSLPFRQLAADLASLYPSEREGIYRFFEDMMSISGVIREPSITPRTGLAHRLEVSAASYLEDLIKDQRLRRILGSMGTRKPYSGLPLLAAMWELLCEKGIHYPREGMRYLADILVKAIAAPSRKNHIQLGAEVADIRVEDGRACGIALTDGSVLTADAILSNADFKNTFLRLLSPGVVPAGLRQALSTTPQTMSNLQVCLGLDSSRMDFTAFGEASRIIYRNESVMPGEDEGPDWKALEIDPSDLAGSELEIDLLSQDDPSLAPPGKAVLVIRVAADHRHFARFRPQWGKRSHGYLEYKNHLARTLIAEASNLSSGLGEAIEVMDVATPLTFEERGGRSDGAVAGWSWDYGIEHGLKARELVLTPIAGLYMAGYQAYSMLALGGVPSAMHSGLQAAEYLMQGAGPSKEIAVPGYHGP
jgi:phytoene dehydrogenase-like protein